MRLSPSFATVLLLAAAAPAVAHAGPAGFSTPAVVGSGPVHQSPASAIGSGGRATLAWLTPPGPVGAVMAAVIVVRREPGTGAWGANEVVAPGSAAIDPPPERAHVQVAAADTTVVAWAESRRGRSRVVAASAPPGGPFGRPQVIADVGNLYAATPRLVATTSGRFVLAWRDRSPARLGALRYALSARGRRFGPPRLLIRGGHSPALVATKGGDVIAAWRVRRGLRAARLAAGARDFGKTYLVSRSAAVGPRLAAAPGGTVVASWISRSARLQTRRIVPLGRAQTLAQTTPQPEGRTPGAAAVATGPNGSSIAASARFGQVWGATLDAAGHWRSPQPLAEPSPHTLGGVRAAVSRAGEGLVVWYRSVGPPERPEYEVTVARRPARASGSDAAARLGPGPGGVDPRGLVVLAQGAGTILAAWPSPEPAGGMLVATRPDS